ncbi:MAG: hypothetical protein KJZ65_06005 [Phycisphaerales bacterium]|nr:hypothetical protein [Phycisphaerales bacterium]
MGKREILGAVAALAIASTAFAGVQTYTIDFFPDDPGAINIMLGFITPALTGKTIVQTRLFVEFTPLSGYDAGDLYFLLAAPVIPDADEDGFIYLESGADMGWSGQGTFFYENTFTSLNGVLQVGVWQHDVFPTFDPPIYQGFFSADSRWEIDYIPAPATASSLGGLLLVGSRRRRR